MTQTLKKFKLTWTYYDGLSGQNKTLIKYEKARCKLAVRAIRPKLQAISLEKIEEV